MYDLVVTAAALPPPPPTDHDHSGNSSHGHSNGVDSIMWDGSRTAALYSLTGEAGPPMMEA